MSEAQTTESGRAEATYRKFSIIDPSSLSPEIWEELRAVYDINGGPEDFYIEAVEHEVGNPNSVKYYPVPKIIDRYDVDPPTDDGPVSSGDVHKYLLTRSGALVFTEARYFTGDPYGKGDALTFGEVQSEHLHAEVNDSTLSTRVILEAGSRVINSTIGPGVEIGHNTEVKGSRVLSSRQERDDKRYNLEPTVIGASSQIIASEVRASTIGEENVIRSESKLIGAVTGDRVKLSMARIGFALIDTRGVRLESDVTIEASKVEGAVTVQHAVSISNNSTIAVGSEIGQGSILSDTKLGLGIILGASVKATGADVGDGTRIGDKATLVNATVGEDNRVGERAKLEGNSTDAKVMTFRNVKVGHEAQLTGATSVSTGSEIGTRTILHNSRVGDNVSIGGYNDFDTSTFGAGTRVGRGRGQGITAKVYISDNVIIGDEVVWDYAGMINVSKDSIIGSHGKIGTDIVKPNTIVAPGAELTDLDHPSGTVVIPANNARGYSKRTHFPPVRS